MRVLVVDQDATLLEALVRALAGQFTIDILTNKSDCVDLLRKTEFEVIVACERLADGSGLELLGQVAKRAPDTLRVFAAERERLALLRGKLGPFDLFATLAYPIDPRKLLSTLVTAAEDLHSQGGSATIEHVVLSSEPEPPPPAKPVTPPVRQQLSREPRVSTTKPAGPGAGGSRSKPLAASVPRARPTQRTRPTQASREPSREASREPTREASRKTTAAAPPSATRPFAALEGVAEIAAAARASAQEPASPATRTAFIAGAGIAAVAVAVVLGARFVSGGHETKPVGDAQVAAAPHYSQGIVDLVSLIESDFTQDDFRKAESDIQRLQSLAPDHPRLRFFQSLIVHHTGNRHGEPPTKVATSHSSTPGQAAKQSSESPHASAQRGAEGDRAEPARAPAPPVTPTSTPTPAAAPKAPGVAPSPAPSSHPQAPSASEEGTQFAATTSPIAAPRGPMSDAPPAAPAVTSTFSGRTVADSTAATAGATAVTAGATAAVPTPPPTPNPHRLGSGEPPPVVAPAQLTRRVAPDYPQAAVRQGIEGFAEVRFTVTAKGTVSDVSIVQSTPPEIFDRAAIDAVRRWRYEPRTVDGKPTETQLQVKLQFKLDPKK